MFWKPHSPHLGRSKIRKKQTKKKSELYSGKPSLESNIRKTCEKKNLIYFEVTGTSPYSDMVKNGCRGLNGS